MKHKLTLLELEGLPITHRQEIPENYRDEMGHMTANNNRAATIKNGPPCGEPFNGSQIVSTLPYCAPVFTSSFTTWPVLGSIFRFNWSSSCV